MMTTKSHIGKILLLSIFLTTVTSVGAATVGKKTISVRGIASLDIEEVSAIISKYEGREIVAEDIAAIINDINKLYTEKGFVNSGVIFPSQTSDEVVELEAIEGHLAEIEFINPGRLSEKYIRSVVDNEINTPLNIMDLQRAFSLLEQEETIAAVRGRLLPGEKLGSAKLELEILEVNPLSISININNYRSPSVGGDQIQFQLRHINLSGVGDEFSLSLNVTEGMEGGSIAYTYPFSGLRTELGVYYSRGDTVVVEAPFSDIDIENETDTLGFKLETLLFSTLSSSIRAQLGLEIKKSTSSLLGLPFDFSQGSVDGESRATVFNISLGYQLKTRKQAASARLTFRKGIDAFNATQLSGDLVDGEFDMWQLQLSYVHLFEREGFDWTLKLSLNSQFTSDTLQSFERFPLGGHQSIRGFRENQVLRDEVIEFRAQLTIPVYETGKLGGIVSVYPFLDWGRAENARFQSNVEDEVDLSSLGIGITASFQHFRFQFEWAQRLQRKREQGDSLQDDGLHIGISYVF